MTTEERYKYGFNAATREVYLHSVDSSDGDPGVEYQMATRFLKNIHTLEHKSSQPIYIHATSIGGEWESGMVIFDAIQCSKCPIAIYGYGDIASMMSIVFQAADYRVMMPNSVMTLHYGYSFFDGVAQAMDSWNTLNKERNDTMFDIYAEACALTKDVDVDAVRKQLMKNVEKNIDWFLTPQEAVRFGLADEVWGE